MKEWMDERMDGWMNGCYNTYTLLIKVVSIFTITKECIIIRTGYSMRNTITSTKTIIKITRLYSNTQYNK